MPRSSNTERAERLNVAFDFIARGLSLNEAAQAMVAQFGLSHRQAYRYLQGAQRIRRPVAIPEPIIPVTIKIPADVAGMLRAHAQATGRGIGDIVARALLSYLARARRHG
ncbi:MAG: ribbon-helix-helix protein, CopG family [Steroidobacteraceae bacterium]